MGAESNRPRPLNSSRIAEGTQVRRRTGGCRETRLTLVAGGTCASPRLRQSLAALGSVYGLNEKQISSSPVPQCLREKSSSDSHP
ncbi:MAG: hypothetical protein ACKO9H_00705, partial [Planctomycetota bacterium]